MARPKLPEELKKERVNLTLSKEVKEMLDAIRDTNKVSISEFLEESVRKEYRRLVKKGLIKDNEQVKGQMSIRE
ncbi:ribbon-helix-helix protein, CopG family [Gemmiger sp.]